MTYTVLIRNNTTMEVKPYLFHEEFHEFIWSEGGNYACDCNLHIFFTDHEAEDDDIICGHGKYEVIDVFDEHGLHTEEMIDFLRK